MHVFYWYILLTLIMEIGIILVLSRIFKKRLPSMAGMILSMTYAMTISLIVGLTFGVMYQGDLFSSTIIALFLGMVAGILAGVGLGLLTSIEGAMSGLMGGMMGAMLGEMISTKDVFFLIILLLTISVCSLLLFFVFCQSNQDQNKFNKSWYLKPLFSMVGISAYLILGFQLSQGAVKPSADHGHQHRATGTKDPKVVSVQAVNNAYTPASFVAKVGEEIILQLNNMDGVEHDIEIKGLSVKTMESSHHNLKGPLHLHALANSKNEIRFTPLEIGEYEFYCTVPGHKKAGMVGKVIVTNK